MQSGNRRGKETQEGRRLCAACEVASKNLLMQQAAAEWRAGAIALQHELQGFRVIKSSTRVQCGVKSRQQAAGAVPVPVPFATFSASSRIQLGTNFVARWPEGRQSARCIGSGIRTRMRAGQRSARHAAGAQRHGGKSARCGTDLHQHAAALNFLRHAKE